MFQIEWRPRHCLTTGSKEIASSRLKSGSYLPRAYQLSLKTKDGENSLLTAMRASSVLGRARANGIQAEEEWTSLSLALYSGGERAYSCHLVRYTTTVIPPLGTKKDPPYGGSFLIRLFKTGNSSLSFLRNSPRQWLLQQLPQL
jgi:hypothetical protein